MKTNEREEKILDILREQRFAAVSDLASSLYTSPSSIRRDLTNLENRGLVRRNYGGVMLREDENTALPMTLRIEAHKAEKRQIARQASTLLRDNTTIFLDGSSTVSYLIEFLTVQKNITVFTNNLQTAAALIEKSVDTYCIGGHSIRNSPVVAGSYAEDMVSNLHADIFFFSSFALSDDGMISDCTPEENSLRKRMLSCSDCRVFLCDSSKFHRSATHRLCTLDEVDYYFFDTPLVP